MPYPTSRPLLTAIPFLRTRKEERSDDYLLGAFALLQPPGPKSQQSTSCEEIAPVAIFVCAGRGQKSCIRSRFVILAGGYRYYLCFRHTPCVSKLGCRSLGG